MLVLSRRPGEKILLPSLHVAVQVLTVKKGSVRLGIDAPHSVPVLRAELSPVEGVEPQLPAAVESEALRQGRHQLRNRLNAIAVGLGLLRRQQQMGLTLDAENTLSTIDEELEALRRQLDEAQPARPAPRPQQARRALLVEDDQNERELLAGFLRLAGLEVDTAADGADALDWLQSRGHPDVMLCDMALPRCDGPTVVRAVRRNPAYAGMKIYGVTGQLPEVLGLDHGPTGVDRWFRKPLNPTVLLAELTEELRKDDSSHGR